MKCQQKRKQEMLMTISLTANGSKDPQIAGLSDKELVVLQHKNNFGMMPKIFWYQVWNNTTAKT